MSRRGENIYKRKDGRWEGRYSKGRKTNGKIHYGYTYGSSYKETKQKLIQLKFEFQQYQTQEDLQTICIETIAVKWLQQMKERVKPATLSTYRYKLDQYILPIIGELEVAKLTAEHLQKMIEQWQLNGLSATTIQLSFRLVKAMLKDAKSQSSVPVDLDIRLPARGFKKVNPLSKEEQQKLEQAALTEKYGLAVILALHTGLRIGEISALRWEDVNLQRGTLTVKHTYQRIKNGNTANERTTLILGKAKTNASERMIPLSKRMQDLFTGLKEDRLNFVFQYNGQPIEPRLLTYHFHNVLAKAGLKNVHFHQLRHTFATRLLESRTTISSISALLGHTSTKTTLDIYTGSLLNERLEALENMETSLLET